MFDSTQWTSEVFDHNVAVAIGERQLITFTIPARVVIAITAIYWDNTDAIAHTISLGMRPLGVGNVAQLALQNVPASSARSLFPFQGLPAQSARVLLDTPAFFNGPLDFIIENETGANAAHTPRIMMRWMQLQPKVIQKAIAVVVAVL